ncbi:hypothetical protein F2P79_001236 [Pimephales promelas]|nr:hypothetical protein F2P79_001236 [Pimephales promelas]
MSCDTKAGLKYYNNSDISAVSLDSGPCDTDGNPGFIHPKEKHTLFELSLSQFGLVLSSHEYFNTAG